MKLYEIILMKIFGKKVSEKPPRSGSETKIDTTFFNPISCDLNSIVKINAIDYRDYRFSVKEIKEHSIVMGNKTHKMTDFILSSKDIDELCLRVVPDKKSNGNWKYKTLVMTLYDSIAYDEGLHDVVRDDTKKFVIDDDTDESNIIHDEFWRVNDVGISYLSNIKVLPDGKNQIEFWDFSRNTDVDGVEIEEFLFVQMNKHDGWFEIWKGSEVDPSKIEVF